MAACCSFARRLALSSRHPGSARWILHVDLDQFLAAVEVLRRPELAGRPVVVGGDGNPARPRQVVATASYEARAFGVRSGMPLMTAARRCPGCRVPAVGQAGVRGGVGARDGDDAVMGVAGRGLGWDEAFVGVDDRRSRGASPASCKRRLLAETGLSCAVGIGETKLQAKTATGFAKPGGVARLTRREWIPTMGDRPVTAIWGIGNRIAAASRRLGIDDRRASWPRADHAVLAARSGRRSGRHCGCRPRRRRRAGRRRAARRQGPQPRGDVRRVTSPTGDEIRAQVARLGARGHRVRRRRGPARHACLGEGAHGDVLHPHRRSASSPSRRPTPRSSSHGRAPCSTASSCAGRCACSACASCSKHRPDVLRP